MRAPGLRDWLKSKDPGLVAVKRAVRVTLAHASPFTSASTCSMTRRWQPSPPLVASPLVRCQRSPANPGSAPKSTALRYWPASAVSGTVLAVNTWAAVAGMLVVGFAIAYAGVGGPRVVGAANGLQLLYILPSFPPYAPESLGSRLIGLILGVGLLAIADRVLWPPPVPKPFRHRLAEATRAVHDRLVTVLNSEGDRQPQAQPSVISLRLLGIPPLERPTGPGRRDRAAMHAVAILRLEARVGALAGLTLTHRVVPLQSITKAGNCWPCRLSLDESADALES